MQGEQRLSPVKRPQRRPKPSAPVAKAASVPPTVAAAAATSSNAPPRPPPPKLFSSLETPKKDAAAELPDLEPPETLRLPRRNPKLYELVALSQESSFWWDSVDATAIEDEDDVIDGVRFDDTVSISVVNDDDEDERQKQQGSCVSWVREC